MFANLTGWHALLILAVILLLFGAAKLPALARSVGQSARVLKTEIRSDGTAPEAQAPYPTAVDGVTPASAPVPRSSGV
ncbi:MAG: twin-arginine translocase TatA/TatE family subunit [Microbacterium sp.]